MYVTMGIKKFVPKNNPDSDGLIKYPTSADGTVETTNNNA